MSKMSKEKAAEVLGLSGSITSAEIKARYRELSLKYHPDLWPNGQHMQSMINNAYEALKGFSGELGQGTDANITAHIGTALFALSDLLGLEFEICGTWLWVTGETKKHKEALKGAGLRYHHKKVSWYLAPPGRRKFSGKEIPMEQIRGNYGSYKPKESKRKRALAIA
tara:strand:- start:343 stop:843 length:501 start_codon:yes stop_codon:yes gene_type:complete